MSVHIKTPTKVQFDHPHTKFPCGETGDATLASGLDDFSVVGASSAANLSSSTSLPTDQDPDFALNVSSENPEFSGGHKRKFRERSGSIHSGNRKKQGRFHKTGEKTVLPSKFLLGGNITDPLNLNALYHDDFGKVLNERTPQSSPLPLPEYKQQVQVLIPPNINDPLNLNVDVEPTEPCLTSPKCSGKKKKHKHNRKRRSTEATLPMCPAFDQAQPGQSAVPEGSSCRELHFQMDEPERTDDERMQTETATEVKETKLKNSLDTLVEKLLSPVVPQTTAGPASASSKTQSSDLPKQEQTENSSKEQSERLEVSEKPKPDTKPQFHHHHGHHGHRNRKHSHPGASSGGAQDQAGKKDKHPGRHKFVYGNYDRYYGYRNPGEDVDNRLGFLQSDWFRYKEVLDIGCNIGHITLTIARDYKPKRILGMDIDNKLISIAKKNIRHYMSSEVANTSKFPVSMTRDPIAAPSVPSTSNQHDFPQNVMFMQGNYVLDTDEELDLVQEEYDTILALSLTKWLHLNFGDDGLKRAFKRMHKQLRPGGKLILEPQPYSSYKKKKKLSETIFKNFQAMRFRPEQFTEYLLSREVGFIACEHMDAPFNKSQGFQRPLQVYTKSETNSTPVEGVTPLMEIYCTPCTTPQLSASHTYVETSMGTPPMFDAGPSV